MDSEANPTYDWDFGDGTGGAGVFPSHRYDRPGLYTAELFLSDDEGNQSSASGEIEVFEARVVDLFLGVEGWTPIQGEWNIVGGRLETQAQQALREHWAWAGAPPVRLTREFEVEFNFEFLATPADPIGRHGGVMFAASAPGIRGNASLEGYTLDWIDRDFERGFRLIRWDGGSFTPLVRGTPAVLDPPAKWLIVVERERISVFGDGNRVLEVSDSTYRGGYFGVWAYFNGQSIQVEDVKASSLPDLSAGRLEVTQGCQDLNNSVRLVEGKRTFVRFHVFADSSPGREHPSYATLLAERDGNQTELLPSPASLAAGLGSAPVAVKAVPDRADLRDSFLFALPSSHTRGTVQLTGRLNPELSWRGRQPVEPDYTNNTSTVTVTFEPVPEVNLVMYRVGYRVGQTTYCPPAWQRNQLVSWMERTFPLSSLKVIDRTFFQGTGLPRCDDVNLALLSAVIVDRITALLPGSQARVSSATRYYGMVDDGGGFMRGCSAAIPSPVASGPTGIASATTRFAWDTDGTYGDWYGAHEIAHSFGRFHAEFCGATDGAPFPYPNGLISPTVAGNGAIFGFDIRTRQVHRPTSGELMGYCDNQWLSDVTYEALMDAFQAEDGGAALEGAGAGVAGAERLLILGAIAPATNAVNFSVLRLADAGEIEPRLPGPYAIVLRDQQGAELTRYPFTPDEANEGPNEGSDRTVRLLFISEYVPYVAGTARVDIEAAGGVFSSVVAGLQPPSVTVLSPNGGEVVNGDSVEVVWSASDPDRDPLTFSVQYAPDGVRWETVAVGVTGSRAVIDAVNLPAGSAARFRVIACDGINAASDDSDGAFSVPNRPPVVEIEEPVGAVTVPEGATVTFLGRASDPDTGTLPPGQLEWSSSLEGLLGRGASLSVGSLRQGSHDVRFRADDGAGGVAEATVEVTVVADPTQLPPAIDELVARPERIVFDVARGEANALLTITNLEPARSIGWTASVTAPWVALGAAEGATPQSVFVFFADTDLEPGTHLAEIRLASPEVAEAGPVIAVEAKIAQPTFVRSDADDNGFLDITDPIYTLNFLFAGGPDPKCPDAADADDNGLLDITDAIFSLSFAFLGGRAPPAPFPRCGPDPSPDGLRACAAASCP